MKNSNTAVIKKPAANQLTPEQRIEQRALHVSEEAARVAANVAKLQAADVAVEQAAVRFLNDVIKVGIKEVHDVFDSIVENAKSTYDTARRERDRHLKPFEDASQSIRDSINAYYQTLKRIEREELERAEREQAERERLAAIQREEEKKRVQAEVDKQLESLPPDTPESLIEKIIEPLTAYEEPMSIAPPVRVSSPETSGLMSQQSNWRGSIIPGMEIEVLKQVVAGTLPLSIVEFRTPELNRMAKLYQGRKSFAGIRFEDVPFVKGTGRR